MIAFLLQQTLSLYTYKIHIPQSLPESPSIHPSAKLLIILTQSQQVDVKRTEEKINTSEPRLPNLENLVWAYMYVRVIFVNMCKQEGSKSYNISFPGASINVVGVLYIFTYIARGGFEIIIDHVIGGSRHAATPPHYPMSVTRGTDHHVMNTITKNELAIIRIFLKVNL